MQGLLKWLLVIAVVVLGWAWWRQQRVPRPPRPTPGKAPATPSHLPEPMLRCRHCGTYVPASDAVRGALGPYCSDEHRRLAEG